MRDPKVGILENSQIYGSYTTHSNNEWIKEKLYEELENTLRQVKIKHNIPTY